MAEINAKKLANRYVDIMRNQDKKILSAVINVLPDTPARVVKHKAICEYLDNNKEKILSDFTKMHYDNLKHNNQAIETAIMKNGDKYETLQIIDLNKDLQKPNYEFGADRVNGQITYISLRNKDKNFSVSRKIDPNKKECYEIGSSDARGRIAEVHGFDLSSKGLITELVNYHYWPKQISHSDIHDAVKLLRNKYQELINPELPMEATVSTNLNYEEDYDKFKSIALYMAQHAANKSYGTPEGLKNIGFVDVDKYFDDCEKLVLEAIESGQRPGSLSLIHNVQDRVDRLFECNDYCKVPADSIDQKPKSYLDKPEGMPNFPKLKKDEWENMNMFANNFLDSFPKADLTQLSSLSPIALQMTKYGVQNANGEIDTEKYDLLTKKLEDKIKDVLKPYPGIGIRLDYECTGAAIKLEMPNGMTLNVPEYSSRKLAPAIVIKR